MEDATDTIDDAPEDTDNEPTTCAVVGPLLYLTVTVETEPDDDDQRAKVHLHPGGQGFWIARMIKVLGLEARLVSPIGGEAGEVVAALVPGWQIGLSLVRTSITTPTQIHDRRTGERQELVGIEIPQLDRHEVDDFYGAALEAVLTSDAVVLTAADAMMPIDTYERLVHDAIAHGKPVFCDLHGEPLDAVLSGGAVDLLKVSEDDLIADGWTMGSEQQAIEAARTLIDRGAKTVVISRGGDPAIAAIAERVVRVTPPKLATADHRGAGDSMTAGIAVGHLSGLEPVDAVRLGAAAGAGNVTRHGLGSGRIDLITELAEIVEIEDVS